jgi:hypothetical protein
MTHCDTDSHVKVLASADISVCIWHDPVRKSAGFKSVLSEIVNDSQELLADYIYIGTSCRDHFKQYIQICTETTFAGNIALVDGNKRIAPPIIPDDTELVNFNQLFAHLFASLSRSQSMSTL